MTFVKKAAKEFQQLRNEKLQELEAAKAEAAKTQTDESGDKPAESCDKNGEETTDTEAGENKIS